MNSLKPGKRPDFIIIGAMKSATTTIYEQLRLLDGVYMPDLKEPNFFSDDSQYARGASWYETLFEAAKADDILGEASTHYTKIPTYPQCFARLSDALPDVKLVYIMRDPIDRLVSQYIHEWSCNNIRVDINHAIDLYPELVKYSCYATQLSPYITHYGKENILPVFFERIKRNPAQELSRIAKFIGYKGEVAWIDAHAKTNVSSARLRTNAFTNFLIRNPILTMIRRTLVPATFRNSIKSRMQMSERPNLSAVSIRKLKATFDEELKILGTLFNTNLDCESYKKIVLEKPMEWSKPTDKADRGRIHKYA
ncbi:sulfotransferase domain-containing protein [Microbulbifer salipaludis]|uniref:Sulfotransferase domain-containing protein n=1 Tax=Microbulbifer salipaludis TaxID=187980 RepID=A0ABS3E2E0_9GAMM|nr:sulfotransferase domain-containing protein [Microbulbifer salipaludis]MBN8429469.1 sulfotransferase domain-containing protein [Microbulbifer salipaludis]